MADWTNKSVHLLYVWKRGRGEAPVRAYVKKLLGADPGFGGRFVRLFSSWFRTNMDGLDQKSYREIVEIADPVDLILSFDVSGLLKETNDTPEAAYAKQFSDLHRKAEAQPT